MPTTKVVRNRLDATLELRVNSADSWGSWIGAQQFSLIGDVTKIYGDDLVDWREKIEASESATTSLDVEGYSFRVGNPGYFRTEQFDTISGQIIQQVESRGPLTLPMWVAPGTSYMSDETADNNAKMKFISKASDAQRRFQGGVVLGELREILHLIRRPGSGIRRLWRDYFRNVRKVARHRYRGNRAAQRRAVTRAITSSWLEFSFGVAPLARDLEDAILAAYQFADRPKSVRVTGRGVDTQLKSGVHTDVGYGPVVLSIHRRASEDVRVKYYGSIGLQNGLEGIGRWYGFSIPDFVPTVWELAPWSFLVDYFTNLGAMIEALTFNEMSVRWINRGARWSRRTSFELTAITPGQPGSPNQATRVASFVQPGTAEFELIKLKREQYIGTLIPSLDFKIPGRWTQWINLSALLAGGYASQRQTVRRFG